MLITSLAILLITTQLQHLNHNINLRILNLMIQKILFILQTNFLKIQIQKSVQIISLFLSNKRKRYHLNGQPKCLRIQVLKANQISILHVKTLLHRILKSHQISPRNMEAKHLSKKRRKVNIECLTFQGIINSQRTLVFIH